VLVGRGKLMGSAIVLAVSAGLLSCNVAWGGSDSGFAVSPASGQVNVPANQPQVSYSVQLTNFNSVDKTFALSVVDFGSLDESGGVAFLGVPTSELEHKYGLAAWMSLPQTTITVPASKTVTVPVVIENRSSLAPGGHYGAILATALTAGADGSDSVGVKQVLSSLVLVTKQGGLIERLGLVSQTMSASWWHLPSTVEQRYHNTGNVHLTPRGVVSVVDPLGHEVERSAINEDSNIVLPSTYRRYATRLYGDGQAWLPGRYTVVSSYRYDGTTQTNIFRVSFWYVGAVVVWLVVGFALLVTLGIIWWMRGRNWFFWVKWRKRR